MSVIIGMISSGVETSSCAEALTWCNGDYTPFVEKMSKVRTIDKNLASTKAETLSQCFKLSPQLIKDSIWCTLLHMAHWHVWHLSIINVLEKAMRLAY